MLKELICRLIDNLIFTIKAWVRFFHLGTVIEVVEAIQIMLVDNQIFPLFQYANPLTQRVHQ